MHKLQYEIKVGISKVHLGVKDQSPEFVMPVFHTPDTTTLSLPSSSVKIHHYGATILSWMVNGTEQLFLSSKAILNGSKAIRGGIPLVFPQFGPGHLQQHGISLVFMIGFARVSVWKFNGIFKDSADMIQVAFSLDQTAIPESFREKWSYDFNLQYTISLTPTTLQVDFQVYNPGSKDFAFTCLLHTYFLVDINTTGIQGLDKIGYKDSLLKQSFTETTAVLKIQQEVDRVYEKVPPELLLSDSKRSLVVRKEGFEDVVVWNPWIEKSKAMADFDDLEYLSMVCVEVGSVANAITLKPGQSWKGTQTLSCE